MDITINSKLLVLSNDGNTKKEVTYQKIVITSESPETGEDLSVMLPADGYASHIDLSIDNCKILHFVLENHIKKFNEEYKDEE